MAVALWAALIAILAVAVGAACVAYADEEATADQHARRLSNEFIATPTVPPPSAADVCNGIEYVGYAVERAVPCYRAVAAERGWAPDIVDAWQPWLITDPWGVLAKESRGCWNLTFGDVIGFGEPCTEMRGGNDGEDAGFGQATLAWYGRNALLCKNHGVCSSRQIIESPYASMLYSVILLVEYDGSGPWCFTRPWNSTGYHQCWRAPDR